MRSLLLAVWLATSLCCRAVAAEPSKTLVGRWRSEMVPTGYWIIDRYPDGRFAEKRLLILDYSKPSEIVVNWGRWKLKGKHYLGIIDGTNSATMRRFAGKWTQLRVISVEPERFKWISSDNQDTYEVPTSDRRPLFDVVIAPPTNLTGPNRTILTPKLDTVPSWVNSPIR